MGEPLSTTEYSSTDIFDIYSILLLNSKNELQWQFLTIAISISVYFLRVWKSNAQSVEDRPGEDRTHSHAQGRRYMPLLRCVAFYSQLHVSPVNKTKASAEVCHKSSKIRLGDRKSSFKVVAPWSVKSMFIFLDHSFLFASQRLQP